MYVYSFRMELLNYTAVAWTLPSWTGQEIYGLFNAGSLADWLHHKYSPAGRLQIVTRVSIWKNIASVSEKMPILLGSEAAHPIHLFQGILSIAE